MLEDEDVLEAGANGPKGCGTAAEVSYRRPLKRASRKRNAHASRRDARYESAKSRLGLLPRSEREAT